MISLGLMLDDARKAVDMFEKLKMPVIGLIENMSLHICPECGHEAHVFGHGGGVTRRRAWACPFWRSFRSTSKPVSEAMGHTGGHDRRP